MTLALSSTKYDKPVQQIAFYDQLLQRVRALPGVASAGAIDSLPMGGGGSTQPIAVEGHPALAMSEQPEVAVRVVEPGFMETMRIPLLQGRVLSAADIADRPSVIVISESMAKRFWPGENPIGKRLKMTFSPEKSREVVGVIGDVKGDGLDVRSGGHVVRAAGSAAHALLVAGGADIFAAEHLDFRNFKCRA